MPVRLGAPPENDFTNPLGLLSDCHRRIERFLNILITIAEQLEGGELNNEMRKGLEVSLKYFREAAPRHTRDEEDSLFPRLRNCQIPELHAALEMMDGLTNDHLAADATHARVDVLGTRWLSNGSLSSPDIKELIGHLLQLRGIYENHIALEDSTLFPLAGKLLDHHEIEALGREMASRRGISIESRI